MAALRHRQVSIPEAVTATWGKASGPEVRPPSVFLVLGVAPNHITNNETVKKRPEAQPHKVCLCRLSMLRSRNLRQLVAENRCVGRYAA
jgi:hypothetical protein